MDLAVYYYPSKGLTPYLQQLYDAMEASNETYPQVIPRDLESAGFWNILRERHKNVIIHLHWIPEPTRSTAAVGLWKYRRTIKTLLIITLLKIVRGAKIMWTIHNANKLHTHPLWTPLLTHWVEALADGYIVHCAASKKDYLSGSDVKPTFIIPHGNAMRIYGQPTMCQGEARQLLGLSKGTVVFLVFGWLGIRKRVDWLLAELQRFPAQDVCFVIAGMPEGDQETNPLKTVVQDRRVLLVPRFIPPGYVRWLFSSADFLVNAQERGYVSGVTMLALSYGLPVINIDWGCASTLVKDGVNGFLFRRDSFQQKLNAALALRAHVRQYNAMRDSAIESVSGYDWKTIGHQTVRAYIELIKSTS